MAAAPPPPQPPPDTPTYTTNPTGRGIRWGLVIAILAAILLLVLWWLAATTDYDGPPTPGELDPGREAVEQGG